MRGCSNVTREIGVRRRRNVRPLGLMLGFQWRVTNTYSVLFSSNGSPAKSPYSVSSFSPETSMSPSHSFFVAHHNELVLPSSRVRSIRLSPTKYRGCVALAGPDGCRLARWRRDGRIRTRSRQTVRQAPATQQHARRSAADRTRWEGEARYGRGSRPVRPVRRAPGHARHPGADRDRLLPSSPRHAPGPALPVKRRGRSQDDRWREQPGWRPLRSRRRVFRHLLSG